MFLLNIINFKYLNLQYSCYLKIKTYIARIYIIGRNFKSNIAVVNRKKIFIIVKKIVNKSQVSKVIIDFIFF